MPLSDLLNQPPKPPAQLSLVAGSSAAGDGGGTATPSDDNQRSSGGMPTGASGTANAAKTPLPPGSVAADVVAAAKAANASASGGTTGDPPGVESDDDDLEDEDEEMEDEASDIPIDQEIVKYPGKCTDLYAVYERWAPILSKEAKEKLVADFSLNDPLYQKPEDIEDPELRLTIRDEWVTVFPAWLANFKPMNAKDDGFQRIPLSDILAMRRMYRTELQARRAVPAK